MIAEQPVRLGRLLVCSSWLFTASLYAQATPAPTPAGLDAGADAAASDAAAADADAAPASEVGLLPTADVTVEPTATLEAPAEAPPTPDAEPEELVVTGSRIKRSPELARAAPWRYRSKQLAEADTNTDDIISPDDGQGRFPGAAHNRAGGGAMGAARSTCAVSALATLG